MMPVDLIELTEYSPRYFSRSEMGDEEGEMIWRNYGKQISVEFPSPKTNGQWRLAPQGWVGHIPLTPELSIYLRPKVPLHNLFGMLDYAYRLKRFKFLQGSISCNSLEEFYETLAKVLSHRVVDRGRKGFYREYKAKQNQLPYVRGRIEVRKTCQKPWAVKPECHYEESTSNIEDNQILAWTFRRILSSGMCTKHSLPDVRRAYRALRGIAVPMPCHPQECVGRLYNRLNQDYQPMHALCRFFLENSGPSHLVGDRTMLPFLVDMAHLYELFVAEWLNMHLPAEFVIKPHEKIVVGEGGRINFDIDLVLYDRQNQKACCVLDTKYKDPTQPASSDIAQVVTYATTKECNDAVLIYPTSQPLDETIGKIRVRSLTFSLDGDLDQAGQAFMRDLLSGDATSSV